MRESFDRRNVEVRNRGETFEGKKRGETLGEKRDEMLREESKELLREERDKTL